MPSSVHGKCDSCREASVVRGQKCDCFGDLIWITRTTQGMGFLAALQELKMAATKLKFYYFMPHSEQKEQ